MNFILACNTIFPPAPKPSPPRTHFCRLPAGSSRRDSAPRLRRGTTDQTERTLALKVSP